MITLTVISINGRPPTQRTAAAFGELGGSIGRTPNNQLVLQGQAVSRLQAMVVCRNGNFAIVDQGTNPLALNGRTLTAGEEAALRPGDQLQIGDYCIAVEAAPTPVAPPRAQPAPDFGFDPAAASVESMPGRGPIPGGAIPAGWNPFDSPRSATPSPWSQRADPRSGIGLDESEKAPPPLGGNFAGLTPAAEPSIGAMFGLDPSAHGNPFDSGPFKLPPAQPNTQGDADPQRALAAAARPIAAPIRDNVPDHALPFYARADPPPAPLPSTGVFVNSWDAAPRVMTMIKPVTLARRAEPAPAASRSALPESAAAGPAPAGEAALLAAFQEGLAANEIALDRLTPELMRLLGQLLREATQGTVDMLMARRALKTEFHAETTGIRPHGNNPLKYSPTAEVALGYLLKPAPRGFVPGPAAMREAYDDLRAHQYGMVAGMHSALQGVMQRFDPTVLESRLGEQSMLSNLVPAHRKARLWELFTELYAQIYAEASDDFERLFGKAFRHAYEARIDDRNQGAP